MAENTRSSIAMGAAFAASSGVSVPNHHLHSLAPPSFLPDDHEAIMIPQEEDDVVDMLDDTDYEVHIFDAAHAALQATHRELGHHGIRRKRCAEEATSLTCNEFSLLASDLPVKRFCHHHHVNEGQCAPVLCDHDGGYRMWTAEDENVFMANNHGAQAEMIGMTDENNNHNSSLVAPQKFVAINTGVYSYVPIYHQPHTDVLRAALHGEQTSMMEI